MKKRILVSFMVIAMLLTVTPLGHAADVPSGVWSDWTTIKPSDWGKAEAVEEKVQYRYKTIIKATSTVSKTMDGFTLVETNSNRGAWSSWQDTPIDPVDNDALNREVKTQESLISYTYGHYCTGRVTGASYTTRPSNDTENTIFNENCVYHEIGDFDPNDSRIGHSSLFEDGYEYYETGSTTKYRCDNTCYTFYRMKTNYKTQYSYRDTTYKYTFEKISDWSEWVDTCPISYYDLQQRTVYRYRTVDDPGTDTPGTNDSSVPVSKIIQTITATNKTIAINSKPVKLGAKTSGNGKLTYSSSAKSVAAISSTGVITPKGYGTTTITIKAAETSSYKANTKNIIVQVIPKKMTIKKAASKKKRTLLITWKKDKTVTGYQVMLSMNKNFKKFSVSRNFKAKVTKQKITSLKSKTWYVRMRAYKKAGGKTIYGLWSKVKKVKIK